MAQVRLVSLSVTISIALHKINEYNSKKSTNKGSVKHMPTVKIRENESFDGAMRRFKRSCEKAGIPSKLRQIEFYEKPTTKRKRKRSAAVKRQQKRLAMSSGKFPRENEKSKKTDNY